MPYRKTPFVVSEIYHIFNRSVARQPIFVSDKDHQRGLDVFKFYNFKKPGLRFSHYNRLPKDQKNDFWQSLLTRGQKQIYPLVYCFMPNHIHFLIKEIEKEGISTFMRNFQNSFAKYFNTKTERSGALFQSMFKAVRIETDEQLIHVARYIHLNPLTSYVLRKPEELENYPWSSFPSYIGKIDEQLINKSEVLGYFKSIEDFKTFTFDQVDYQRKLDEIGHLLLE